MSALVVRTEKLEATEEKPTRIRALFSVLGPAVTLEYDHSLSPYANSERALRELCKKEPGDALAGSMWVGTSFEHGYMFIRVFTARVGEALEGAAAALKMPMAHELITIEKTQ